MIRIALARAVYAKTKVVLLDDVFSAVVRLLSLYAPSFAIIDLASNQDAHTARHIATQLFGGTLLEGRTVVRPSSGSLTRFPL